MKNFRDIAVCFKPFWLIIECVAGFLSLHEMHITKIFSIVIKANDICYMTLKNCLSMFNRIYKLELPKKVCERFCLNMHRENDYSSINK